ncbi:MAG TPA: MBOAT family O-acyltransferase [Opitutus sp.]|nr:MBOAT family O-acyltransferase [Opitutus sp.]
MLFQTLTFLWEFLLPVLVLFYAAARLGGTRWALAMLVIASLVFYGWTHPAHLAVLLSSMTVNYLIADRIIALRPRKAGFWFLVGGVCFNVSLLAWFKYAAFFSDVLNSVIGWEWGLQAVLLPLGISFITFQKIAYLVDAWRGQFSSQRWSDYALFVTFFPQLIAGPIVHQPEFLPQIQQGEFARWRSDRIAAGAAIFVLGMGKKLLLADAFGRHADQAFDHFAQVATVSAVEAWLGVLAYTFQIYFDFSAYSDMAIGLGLLFGVTSPENFAAPYRATSLIEFWRRWHITLSRFLRDYLYLPLGGNAGGRPRQVVNLSITMLIGGLWHGPAWTFVAWGAAHGTALSANHLWRRSGWRCPGGLGWIATFLFVSLAWVLFRAQDFAAATSGFRALSGFNGLWPDGGSEPATWLRSLKPAAECRDLHLLFGSLDTPGIFGLSGPELSSVLLSEPAILLVRLMIAAGIVLFGQPTVRWLWNLAAGQPRFSLVKAAVVAGVLGLTILQGVHAVPSTFIYFRF